MHRFLRSHLIMSPTTNCGKTVFSSLLINSSLLNRDQVYYLKPVSTGSISEADDTHITRYFGGRQNLSSVNLWRYNMPVSPHLAPTMQQDNEIPSDEFMLKSIREHINSSSNATKNKSGVAYIETAGGVHSPTMSGESQLDVYRNLRYPVILVASHELGGISTTRSAYESILTRGLQVDAVVCFKENYYRNWEFFRDYFGERRIPFGIAETPPSYSEDPKTEQVQMSKYYEKESSFESIGENILSVNQVEQKLQIKHDERIRAIEKMPEQARKQFWWAFVQHGLVKSDSDVTVIDSANGDFYNAYRPKTPETLTTTQSTESDSTLSSKSLLQPYFDATASWWTQCLGHGHPELTLAGAYASGRYGHVIFPLVAHQPALDLADRLLSSVGKGWADRVFFTDNGSTGMEVALKMALHSFVKRNYLDLNKSPPSVLNVLGLRGSYHGDTIGAMDATEPNHYSKSADWHKGRGFWLDCPVLKVNKRNATIIMEGKQWDQSSINHRTYTYKSMSDIFDLDRRINEDPLKEVYWNHLEKVLEHQYDKLACLVIEPMVMGSAGMKFVDPLFQRVLVDFVRTTPHFQKNDSSPKVTNGKPSWSGLPVLFDEVFTGLYRLGEGRGAEFLGIDPDISCFAKILSGGMTPLSVVLSNESIFETFVSDRKENGLLHGHSYTGYPIGCAIANKTLEIINNMSENGNWSAAKADWRSNRNLQSKLWSMWNREFVEDISSHPSVEGTMSMGTVLCIYLRETNTSDEGYQSTAAKSFMEAVSRNERYGLFVRPIGSVLYFMTSLNTSREVIEDIQNIIRAGLDEAAIKDGFAKKASPSQDINTNQQQVKVAASY